MHFNKWSEDVFCPSSRSNHSLSNSYFDHFTRWAGKIAKAVIFSSPSHSARRWPQRECEAGTDRQKGFQINLSGQPLRAWLQFVRWKSGNAQVTDVAAATVSQGGFGRASQHWAAIPIRNAGPIPAIHQQGFLLPLTWTHTGCTSALYRNISASKLIGQKHSFFWVTQKARCSRMIYTLQWSSNCIHGSLDITKVFHVTLLDHLMSVWTLLV